jgi:small subunit ribosomal protein S19
MSRSAWKGHFFKKNLLKKKIKKVWCRNSSIPFHLNGQKVFVYNGKEFKKVYITREKIGYKFGEFSFTRKFTKKLKTKKTKSKK